MNYTNTTARSIGLPLVNLAPTYNYSDRTEDHPANGKSRSKRSRNDRILYNVTATQSQEELLTRYWNSIPQVNSNVKDPYPLSRGKAGGSVILGIQEVKPEINSLTGERSDHIGVVELHIRGDYSEWITDGEWTEAISRLISSLPWNVVNDNLADSPRLVLGVNSLLKGAVQVRPDPTD